MDIKQLTEIREWFKVDEVQDADDILQHVHLAELLDLAEEAIHARDTNEADPGLQAFEHLKRAADLLKLSDADRATLSGVAERSMGMPSGGTGEADPGHGPQWWKAIDEYVKACGGTPMVDILDSYFAQNLAWMIKAVVSPIAPKHPIGQWWKAIDEYVKACGGAPPTLSDQASRQAVDQIAILLSSIPTTEDSDARTGIEYLKLAADKLELNDADREVLGNIANRSMGLPSSETSTPPVRPFKADKLGNWPAPSEDWQPNDEHKRIAWEAGIDIDFHSKAFLENAKNNGCRYRDWDHAFLRWLSPTVSTVSLSKGEVEDIQRRLQQSEWNIAKLFRCVKKNAADADEGMGSRGADMERLVEAVRPFKERGERVQDKFADEAPEREIHDGSMPERIGIEPQDCFQWDMTRTPHHGTWHIGDEYIRADIAAAAIESAKGDAVEAASKRAVEWLLDRKNKVRCLSNGDASLLAAVLGEDAKHH